MGEEIQCVLGVIDALDKKFSSSITELKNKVMAGQEAASQEVVKRIDKLLGVIDALDKKFSSSITELKNKVMAGQEAASQEVVKRIDKRSYQFQKKRERHTVPVQCYSQRARRCGKEGAGKGDSRSDRGTTGHHQESSIGAR